MDSCAECIMEENLSPGNETVQLSVTGYY